MNAISSDVLATVEKFARECSDEYSKAIDRKDQIMAYITGESEQYPDILENSNTFRYYTLTELEKLSHKDDSEVFFRASAVVLRAGNMWSRRYYASYDPFAISLGKAFTVDSLNGQSKNNIHKFDTLLHRLTMIQKYAGDQVIQDELNHRMKNSKFRGKELAWVHEATELLMLLDLYTKLNPTVAQEMIESLPPLLQAVLHQDEAKVNAELQGCLEELVLYPLQLKDNESSLNLSPEFVQGKRDHLRQSLYPNVAIEKNRHVSRENFESVLLQVSTAFLFRLNRHGGKGALLDNQDEIDGHLISAVQVLYELFPFEMRKNLIKQKNIYHWMAGKDFEGILSVEEPYDLIEQLVIDLNSITPSWDSMRGKVLANVDQGLRLLQIVGQPFVKLFVYRVLSEQGEQLQEKLTGTLEEHIFNVLESRKDTTRVSPYIAKYIQGKLSLEDFIASGDRDKSLSGNGQMYDRKQRRMLYAITFLPIESEMFRKFMTLVMQPQISLDFVLKLMSDGYRFSYSRLLETYEHDLDFDGKALVNSVLMQSYNNYARDPELKEEYCHVVRTHVAESLAGYKQMETESRQVILEVLFAQREELPTQQFTEAVRLGLTDTSKAISNLALSEFNRKVDEALFMGLFRTEKKVNIKEMALDALRGVKDSKTAYATLLKEKQTESMKELLTVLLETADQGVHVAHAALGGKLDAKKQTRLSFIPVQHLSPLLSLDGSKLDDNIKLYLLSQSLEYNSQPNLRLKEVATYADQASLAQFAGEILQLWIGEGAPAKEKWVLYLSCLFGDREVMDTIGEQIKDWAENSRGAIAGESIKALSFMQDTAALMMIDRLKRIIKNRQVKTAADEALQLAAENMNLSQEQLEDKLITTLGFNAQGEQSISYGERSFIVKVSADLQIVVLNEETGKLLKSLPAATQKDEPELVKQGKSYFTQLKKDLKNMVSLQALRLEESLSKQRLWKAQDWKELFVDNVIMQKFAICLIWGVFEEGELLTTFRYMEDGTFNTVDEEEYELPPHAQVGLVQPLELDFDTLESWKEQLQDYEITQPFTQIDRQVYEISQENKTETEVLDLPGGEFSPTSFPKALEKLGWYKGYAEDGGYYYQLFKEYEGVIAELEFSGTSISYYESLEDITLKALRFFTTKKDRYHYYQPSAAIKLGQLSPRVYSETMYDILRAAGRV